MRNAGVLRNAYEELRPSSSVDHVTIYSVSKVLHLPIVDVGLDRTLNLSITHKSHNITHCFMVGDKELGSKTNTSGND